jgi:hypothetical protein
MTIDRSHLIPEQRTDRNGNTSTRWVKPSSAEAMAQLGVPAPSLPELTFTEKLVESISTKIADYTGERRAKGIMTRWVGGADKRQLRAIQESLVILESEDRDPAVVREQKVIKSILHSLARGSMVEDEVVIEMLTLRSAFCSARSMRDDAPVWNSELKSYIYGLRREVPLPLDSKGMAKKITAAVQFAYEVTTRCPGEKFTPTEPVEEYAGVTSVKVTAKRYVDANLLELVLEQSDRVDEMIDLAISQRTTEPAVLRSLMDNPDGAKPLAGGWL